DLPPDDARNAAIELEQVSAALYAAAWHSSRPSHGRTQVVVLANEKELREFAIKGLEGFVATDSFEQPIMVVSATQEDQQLFKHELSHVITRGYLISKPRWLDEGIACYLETLKLDQTGSAFQVGVLSRNRMLFLQRVPVYESMNVLKVSGRE